MDQSDPLLSLSHLHLQLTAALEDRLSALNMHHSLAWTNSLPNSQSLICQYGKTVSQIAHTRSNLLLKQQVEVDMEGECRLEMGRWEEKIRILRELLGSKDDELNWKKTTHRQRKRFGLYRNAMLGFEQEEAVVTELICELKTKNQLERQIQQLQIATATHHTPSLFSMPPPNEVDTKIIRQIVREAERHSQLQQQLSQLLKQLQKLNQQHSRLIGRYRNISPKAIALVSQPISQPSSKTICSTSDDESLEAQ